MIPHRPRPRSSIPSPLAETFHVSTRLQCVSYPVLERSCPMVYRRGEPLISFPESNIKKFSKLNSQKINYDYMWNGKKRWGEVKVGSKVSRFGVQLVQNRNLDDNSIDTTSQAQSRVCRMQSGCLIGFHLALPTQIFQGAILHDMSSSTIPP